MIKKILKRRKESDTYLATVSRLMMATVLAESYYILSTFIALYRLQRSTDSSQVGDALFPSC